MTVPAGNQVIAHADQFFIGGDWVPASSDAKLRVIQPATEELYLTVAEAQPADMNRAVAAARDAFDNGPWPHLTHQERAGYLRKIADAITARNDAFARIWSSQTGLVFALSSAIQPLCAQIFNDNADLANTFEFEERHTPKMGGTIGLLVREPVGVVAAIVPWNSPLPLLCYKVAPALLAGCTVIVKASPEAPGEALLFAEAIKEAGLPAGVVNVVTADRGPSEQLVRNPGVDKVTFTGSTAAGKKIAAICSERVARVSLELGGKNAAVVLNDFDVKDAANAFAMTATFVNGQACGAITRVIVQRSRHDALVEAMSHVYSNLAVGDPFAATSQVGPLASVRQRERVEGYLAKGKAEGATVATGGRRPPHLERGFFVEPTVFGNVSNNMTIAREEIFGPVICVIPADSEEHAIAIANDSDFGLNASVYTNDIDRAYRVARRLRSGTVGQNATRGDFSIAFGGFKQSGIHREGGREGLLPFTEAKTLIFDKAPSHLSQF